MAQIAPFRGICFNLSKVGGLDKVVSPPYDTIHAALQQRLLERSPHNIVRLILGNSLPHDGDGEACYGRAAELFRQWQSEEILLRDDQPAIYLYDQNGQIGTETVSRKGFIALARIEDFSSGWSSRTNRPVSTGVVIACSCCAIARRTSVRFSPSILILAASLKP